MRAWQCWGLRTPTHCERALISWKGRSARQRPGPLWLKGNLNYYYFIPEPCLSAGPEGKRQGISLRAVEHPIWRLNPQPTRPLVLTPERLHPFRHSKNHRVCHKGRPFYYQTCYHKVISMSFCQRTAPHANTPYDTFGELFK